MGFLCLLVHVDRLKTLSTLRKELLGLWFVCVWRFLELFEVDFFYMEGTAWRFFRITRGQIFLNMEGTDVLGVLCYSSKVLSIFEKKWCGCWLVVSWSFSRKLEVKFFQTRWGLMWNEVHVSFPIFYINPFPI